MDETQASPVERGRSGRPRRCKLQVSSGGKLGPDTGFGCHGSILGDDAEEELQVVYKTCWSMLCWTGGPSWLSHTNLSRMGDQRVGKVAGRPA